MTLLDRLQNPDFVILSGAQFRQLTGEAVPQAPAVSARKAVVEKVAVQGEIIDELAYLNNIEIVISLEGDGAEWVPIHLDGQIVTGAREGNTELDLREVENVWQVRLEGAGRHSVRVATKVPIRSDAVGQHLELVIPEAASTRVSLNVPAEVIEAEAGPKEPLDVSAIEGGQRKRIQASLPARRQLDLTWRVAVEPGDAGPPVLMAQGEIAIDINRGTFMARSSWVVKCERGAARSLELRLDQADELLSLDLHDQPLPIEGKRDPRTGIVTIPLVEPLRPGTPLRLGVTTRRSLSAGAATRLVYSGVPLAHAIAQSGVLAIARGGDLWISGDAGRGLRQIDPRSELPDSLRTRPSTVLAYQFVSQPFDLNIRVDPSPPTVRVEGRTTVAVEPASARIDTLLNYQVTRGRIFELRLRMPEGLELESVGPEATIASHHELEASSPLEPESTAHTLVLSLTEKAREDGTFAIHLQGRQRIDPERTVPIGLFAPRGASWRGGTIAVLAARNVSVDLAEEGNSAGDAGAFAPLGPEAPTDWVWPEERPAAGAAPALWLRHEENAETLPVHVAVRSRTIHHETTLTVLVERRRLDSRQTCVCHVRNGTLSRIDVAVPAAIEGRWELSGDEVAGRERLGIDPDGTVHYRLSLSREVTDTVQLRFQYRLPLEPGLSPDQATRLELPWVHIEPGSASPAQVQVKADPGIRLAADGPGWVHAANPDLASVRDGGPPVRLSWTGPETGSGPPPIQATALALAPMPSLVASRLWLRTVQGPDGGVRVAAWYRVETHEGSLSVALPEGAEWVRARVGNDPIVERERLPREAGDRIRLPDNPPGPVLVGLEYVIAPEEVARHGWGAPRLLDGGTVQQTLWEVRVPWNRALVGVPGGWTDENQWYWDGYVWKRRPWKSASDLEDWVGGPSAQGRLAGAVADDQRGGSHGYLFGRPGAPRSLRPSIQSRALLVALCSGMALALGVVLLVWRPPGRLLWLIAPAAALAAAAALEPSITWLAIQSSMVGLFLTLVAAVTQRLVERRQSPAPLFGESSLVQRPGSTGSTRDLTPAVGSDESTVVRARAGTTIEHIPAPVNPLPAESPLGRGSSAMRPEH